MNRPIVNGLPVPWVASWSNERVFDPRTLQSWKGIVWLRNNNPTGEPQFGMTNSWRQRECMRRRRCQVCGDKGADVWVVPDDSRTDGLYGRHHGLWKDGALINPPVHEACFETSQTLCPHLARIAPLAVVRWAGPIEYVGCSATSLDGRQSAAVSLAQARAERWIGRELIIALPESVHTSVRNPATLTMSDQ